MPPVLSPIQQRFALFLKNYKAMGITTISYKALTARFYALDYYRKINSL